MPEFLLKAWPFLVIAFLSGALYLTRDALEDTKAELATELAFRQDVANFVGAKNGKATTIMVKLRASAQTSLNRKTTLETISQRARDAKTRADAADIALKREQQTNARKFAAAQRSIDDLNSRGPEDGDAAIEEDSKAAWRGWK